MYNIKDMIFQSIARSFAPEGFTDVRDEAIEIVTSQAFREELTDGFGFSPVEVGGMVDLVRNSRQVRPDYNGVVEGATDINRASPPVLLQPHVEVIRVGTPNYGAEPENSRTQAQERVLSGSARGVMLCDSRHNPQLIALRLPLAATLIHEIHHWGLVGDDDYKERYSLADHGGRLQLETYAERRANAVSSVAEGVLRKCTAVSQELTGGDFNAAPCEREIDYYMNNGLVGIAP